jgi:hypothetical protein
MAGGDVIVLTAHRGHRDDPARAAGHHDEHRGTAQVVHAVQAGVDHGPPVSLGEPRQRLFPGDAGAADHRLDRAEFLLGQPEPGTHLGGVGDVHVGPDRVAAEFAGVLLHLAR